MASHSVRSARHVASRVVLVVPDGYVGDGEGADVVVTGGDTRAASVRAGLAHCGDATIVVVHDAARPAASEALFRAVLRAVQEGADGAIPGQPVVDTLKRVSHTSATPVVESTLSRDDLVAVQTPQAFQRDVLERAHASGAEATDDAGLVEAIGGRVVVVPGERANVKITEAADLERLRGTSSAMRIGHGFDVHRFSGDRSRPLRLGLVAIAESPGLLGHSDADVVAHAVADALLGAAGLGDLGRHFPDHDPATEGVSSLTLLQAVVDLVAGAGYYPISLDVTILAERPVLAPLMPEMAARLTEAVGAPVSVKATTTEGLGAIGRAEGIAATAVALVVAS